MYYNGIWNIFIHYNHQPPPTPAPAPAYQILQSIWATPNFKSWILPWHVTRKNIGEWPP